MAKTKSSSFHSRSKNDGIMVIYGFGAESRPAWTRMVAVWCMAVKEGSWAFRR